jgi:carbon-monoxide dehydrogenase small subunit
MEIELTVNGTRRRIETTPTRPLLEILREDLGLTAAKEACGEGECGACTVLFNGRLVQSCLILALQADGAEILTPEGVEEETRALRDAFVREDGVQCGFCTPGFVLAGYDYLRRGGTADPEAIRSALDGNLCRCTGYYAIVKAIEAAAKEKES